MEKENKPLFGHFKEQILSQNQVLVAILGICSALAVTNRLSLALTMGISVTFVVSFSAFFVSLLRHKTPESVRMITQLTIISLFVIIIDQFLKAYFYSMSKVLSVYTGLIITNCLVMGRTESFARHKAPHIAFIDGLGAGLGYAIVIAIVAIIREFFAFGEFFDIPLLPSAIYASAEHPDRYQNAVFMATPAASFFIIGLLISGVKSFLQKEEK